MPLSKSQMALYWREWKAAKTVLMASNGYSDHEAEDWRRETTATALTRHKKPAEMSNRDMDMMLSYFRGVSAPDDFAGQMRLEAAERTRLITGIETDSSGPAWLSSICRSIYGTDVLEDLATADLLKLRRRCANAARSAKMKTDVNALLTAK